MTRPVHVTRSTARNGAVIGELRLARSERGNALDEAMLDAITDGCAELAGDSALRAVLLTAEGRHFCAGADLAWMRRAAELSDEENVSDAGRLDAALDALAGLPIPLVAKTRGCAYGGGVGLLCCADIVLAETGATFRFSEPLLGLVPAVISPYVVRAIGLRRRAVDSSRRRLSTRSKLSRTASSTKCSMRPRSRNERARFSTPSHPVVRSRCANARRCSSDCRRETISARTRSRIAG